MWAYLDMVNAHGGVYGRKIVLSEALDDGTVNNEQVTRTLVQQDHVFAIVGVATAAMCFNAERSHIIFMKSS